MVQYSALGETAWGYTELIQGRVLMSPSPSPDHARAMLEFAVQLRDQLPGGWAAIPNLDIDLELAAADEPGFSRRPDLVVLRDSDGARSDDEGRMIRASEVAVVVEIVTADTRRIDLVDKRRDYADAGIPHYWIVDIDDPISVTARRLTEPSGYRDDRPATGFFRADAPFPVEIDLNLRGERP